MGKQWLATLVRALHSPTSLVLVGAALIGTLGQAGLQEEGKKAAAVKPRTDLYGDPLPPGALARMGTVRFAHGDSMSSNPVLAPGHKTFVTVSDYTPHHQGRTVCLWDTATGKELRHFHDPDFEYYQAFFLKRENVLATFGISRRPVHNFARDYVVHFWDLKTGKKVRHDLQGLFEPWALSTDEQWLASAERDPPVVVHELKTGKRLAAWEGPKGSVVQLAFSQDGKTVAIALKNGIHLWDWQAKRETRRLGDFSEDVHGVWFSPDGQWLAASIYKEGLRVWDTSRFTEVRRFQGQQVRFLPDGKRLLSMATGVIWDVPSGKEVGRLENCVQSLTLEYSADGKTATGYALGRIRRWDLDTGKDRTPPQLTVNRSMIHQVGFLPDGKQVVSASPDGAVRLWETATGKELRVLMPGLDPGNHPMTFLRVGAGGTIVVARDKTLTFFEQGKARADFDLGSSPWVNLFSANVSPDGKHLVLAGGGRPNCPVQVWDVAGRKRVTSFMPPLDTHLETLAVAPGGREVAGRVGSDLCVISVQSGWVERSLDRRPDPPEKAGGGTGCSYFSGVQTLTFCPQGDLLISGGHPAGAVKVLDVISGKTRHTLAPIAPNGYFELRNAIFSPTGTMLAAETGFGTIEVWETLSGHRRRSFRGHRSYQTTLAFSPDGARLATGNRDATILIWDLFGLATGGAGNSDPPTPSELDALWARLLGPDAERACLAMGRLMRIPKEAVPFLRRQLLAGKKTDAAPIRAWIADLDSPSFPKRQQASLALAEHAASAEPLLKQALTGSPSLEVRRRIEAILGKRDPRPPSPEILRDLRALEVLEHVDTPASREVVWQLADGHYHPLVVVAARGTRNRLAAKSP